MELRLINDVIPGYQTLNREEQQTFEQTPSGKPSSNFLTDIKKR